MAMTIESIRDWHRKQARAKDVCGELRFPGPNESPFYRIPSEESKQHDAMADALSTHLTQPAQAVDVGAAWQDLFWQVALELGCLPSTFVDGNSHVLCAARALAGEKAGWRDIATAPKDGTRIMLTNGHGVWMADYQPVYPSGYRPSNPWSSVLLNHEHMPLVGRHKAPTHWMPLPTPPTDGEE